VPVLGDILVIALEQAVAAPFASCKLAQAGARVIKIERESGDFARAYDHVVQGESAYFIWLNRGKQSLVLDIKQQQDSDLLQRMLARADVFIQNLAPGAADRAGFGSDELRRRFDRLITCDISGYGDSGPYAQMKAYDNLLQGETGLLAVTGTADAPAKVGVSLADIGAGLHAYTALLEALIVREQTGHGSAIKISLFDCLADWMSVPYLHQVYGGKAPVRSGTHHASIAPYGCYRVRDGRQVMIGIQNEREWCRFCEDVLLAPEVARRETFITNSLRVENRAQLDATIDGVFSQLPLEEVVERLRAASIAYARMNSVEELAKHPQLQTTTVDTPSGSIKLPASPLPFRDDIDERVPKLGEHSEMIRYEFAGQ